MIAYAALIVGVLACLGVMAVARATAALARVVEELAREMLVLVTTIDETSPAADDPTARHHAPWGV